MEEGSDGPNKKGSWSIVNWFLGIVCFCLVMYFMNMVRGNKDPSGGRSGGFGRGKGGGLFGNKKSSGGFGGGRSGGSKGGRSGGRR
jgi:hypothetical protein